MTKCPGARDGEKHWTNAEAYGVTAGNGRGQVVWLLVNVQYIRAEVTNEPAQPPKPEEVVAPVESQWRVDNLVAARRRALGHLGLSLFDPPIGRHGQQVKVGIGAKRPQLVVVRTHDQRLGRQQHPHVAACR